MFRVSRILELRILSRERVACDVQFDYKVSDSCIFKEDSRIVIVSIY